jgi:hypothetical protein
MNKSPKDNQNKSDFLRMIKTCHAIQFDPSILCVRYAHSWIVCERHVCHLNCIHLPILISSDKWTKLSCKIKNPIPLLLYPQKGIPFYKRNACESVVTK